MARLGKHLNGDMLCAVDTETSGLIAGFSDIIQIAVVPLNPDLTINKKINPFTTKLIPKRPYNWNDDVLTVGRLTLDDVTKYGLDPWVAVDLFQEWFEKLKLPWNKKIVSVGHNYTFDRDFIIDWLGGHLNYNAYFSGHFRDSMSLALSLNDSADWQNEPVPHAKVKLSYLCNLLNVPLDDAHDALADAVAAAGCYSALLNKMNEIKTPPILGASQA